MEKNGKKLFTINQIANLCSVSRATLIRMEEDGILQPAYKNPDNGYRYYDSENALTVIHNLSLQRLGLTHKEIKTYSPESDFSSFLELLEKKRRHLEDLISEIKARLASTDEYEIEETLTPKCVCYTKKLNNIKYISVIPGLVRETLIEAMNKGFTIEWRIPNSVMADFSDFLNGDFNRKPHDYIVCIPVVLKGKCNENDGNLIWFEADKAISILFSGDARNIKDACIRLGRHLNDNGFKPCGKGRFMGIINEFPRYENPENNHAARIIVPVCSYKGSD